jgi:hypothetical protein
MKEPPNHRFSPGFWLALGAVVVAAIVLFFPDIRIIDGGVSRIDKETATLQVALRAYRAEFGGYPAGDNRAIFRALTGHNPRNIVFIEFSTVSPDGDLLDPWGTPYKIYFSGDEILVRSAGPNKQFDDSRNKHFDDYIR